MEGIFQEFENENALRTYPFASGCDIPDDDERGIPSGVFVDAAIYPINPAGTVYLSSISPDGTFSISDDNGEIMSGVPSGNTVEFYDMSPFSRHVGTLVASSEDVLSEFAGRGSERTYSRLEAAFSANCVFPVVMDGVVSVDVGGAGPATGEVGFSNGISDEVRVSSGVSADGRSTLRFDVLPRPGIKAADSIRRIICVVDGETPFRIAKLAYNVILVTLDGIDKESVCAAAHRENSMEMTDTCECATAQRKRVVALPETYQMEEVFIPPDEVPDGSDFGPEGGVADGADNAFYLVSSNLSGYVNPISITMEDGVVSPRIYDPEAVIDGDNATMAEGALTDSVTSKGVIVQVPGLSGGEA